MQNIVLTEQEWNQVMALLACAPWRDVNMLLMKIGGQLRAQKEPNPPQDVAPSTGNGPSKEVSHE